VGSGSGFESEFESDAEFEPGSDAKLYDKDDKDDDRRLPDDRRRPSVQDRRHPSGEERYR
jgi:hypothetical protein